MLITNYVFVPTFILHLWQFIYKYCSNSFNNIKLKFTYKLLLVQNTFEIYTSEVQFCSSYHVEHNGTISIQNVDHTKEIKYLFEKVACQKKESELNLSSYCSLKVTFISATGRHSLNPKERRGHALCGLDHAGSRSPLQRDWSRLNTIRFENRLVSFPVTD